MKKYKYYYQTQNGQKLYETYADTIEELVEKYKELISSDEYKNNYLQAYLWCDFHVKHWNNYAQNWFEHTHVDFV